MSGIHTTALSSIVLPQQSLMRSTSPVCFSISAMWYFTICNKEQKKPPVSLTFKQTPEWEAQHANHFFFKTTGMLCYTTRVTSSLLQALSFLLLLQEHGCAETTRTWFLHGTGLFIIKGCFKTYLNSWYEMSVTRPCEALCEQFAWASTVISCPR